MSNYRVIHLGGDKWAVRRFIDGRCEETQFVFHVATDPQLRLTEKAIIEQAEKRTDWRQL